MGFAPLLHLTWERLHIIVNEIRELPVPPVCQRRSTTTTTRRNALKIKSCHSIPFRPLDCDLVERKREGGRATPFRSFLCHVVVLILILSIFHIPFEESPPLSLCDSPWQVVGKREQLHFIYPAFDQNSGPEISSHLIGGRNKHVYSSLDGH